MDCQQWCEYTVRILMKQNTTAQEIIYLSAEFILQSPRDKKYLGMSPVSSLHPPTPTGPMCDAALPHLPNTMYTNSGRTWDNSTSLGTSTNSRSSLTFYVLHSE